MSCTAFFTRLLPLRRQPNSLAPAGCPQAAVPSPTWTSTTSFSVLGFRPIDPATSQYQTQVQELCVRDLFPFTMAPTSDLSDDASPPRKKVKTTETVSKPVCCICHTEIDGPHVMPCRTCKKPTCFDCIKGQWLAALSDHERMPVRCCSKIVYHDVAKDILPPTELQIYKLKYDESSTPSPFYCPLPTCSTFIPLRLLKPVRAKITCHICATTSCFKCRNIASDDHKCPEVDEKAQILKSFNYKPCPKCGTGIMRMYGCSHTRCACGAHFCWDCQRPINACYANPCSVARDEGQNTEGDDGDSDSEDEEPAPVTEIPRISVNEGEQPPTEFSAIPDVRQAGGSESDTTRPSSEATAVEIGAQPTTSTSSGAVVTKEEDHPTEPAEVILNLDDPDNPDQTWDNGDYDFGDEPTDEYWDVWGCMHRFKDFDAKDIHDNWLANLEPCKTMAIECMSCFKTIKVEPLKPLGPQTFEDWTATKQENPDAEEELETDTETNGRAARNEKRRLKKNGAFECRECGVIHCWWCRRAAVRRLSNYRKGANA